MNEHLNMLSANIARFSPVVNTGRAYNDGSAHFASANKEYLTIPSNSSLQTGDIDFEIGGWVRFDTVGASDLIYKSNEYSVSMRNYKLYFNVRKDTPFYEVEATTVGALSINTWYFVRAWHDSVGNTINISVNGIANSLAHTVGVSIGAGALNFGGPAYFSGYLNGRLDSWYFQKRISTTAEATALYNAGLGMTSTLCQQYMASWWSGVTSFWDFNSESGTQYDSKGTNHLTATADPIIAPPVYGSELIVNGGFETAGAGGADVFGSWIETAGDGAITNETTVVRSGGHAAKLTGGATPESTPTVNQSIAVTAGASYYLSFWSRGDGTNEGLYLIYDMTNSAYITSQISTQNKTTSYQLFTAQFTAPVGCSSARLYFYSPKVNGGIAYFDDISVKQIITPSINNGGFDLRPATGGEKTNLSTVSRSRTSNVATMVATAHGLKKNDVVTITGMTDTTFNGDNKVVTVVDVDTFTYASTGSDAVSAGDTGGRIATDVFSSWSEITAGTNTLTADSVYPYVGSYAASIISSSSSYLINSNVLISGKKYSSSFYSKLDSVTGAPIFTVEFGNSTSTAIVTPTSSYAPTTVYGTAVGTSFNFKFASAGRTLSLDQVTLTSLGPTAEAGIAAGIALNTNGVSKVLNDGWNAGSFAQITLAKRPLFSTAYFGGCLLFDGVDDGLVATGDKIGVGDVTICAVIRPTGLGGANGGRIIDNGKLFFFVNAINAISVYSDSSTATTSAAASIALNTSYVVIATRTSAGIVNIYINGVLSGTANQNSGTPAAGSDTCIGNRAAYDRAFAGYIGKVGVINRILSLGEIKSVSKRLAIEAGGIY